MSKRNAVRMASLLLTLASFAQATMATGNAQSFAGGSIQTPGASYFIQGAVNKPGVYRIESSPSVLKLITLAGGLSDTHGLTAFIIRRSRPQTVTTGSEVDFGGGYRLIRIDILGLLKGEFEKDALLEAGDIVNIPQTEVFFVAGEVNRVSVFPFREGMTLVQAVSLASGVTVSAKISRVVIFRQDPTTGTRQRINVDLDAVMSGKQKDVHVQPNDIILVPNSRVRNWQFLDAPPIRSKPTCRGSVPCIARLNGGHSGSASAYFIS